MSLCCIEDRVSHLDFEGKLYVVHLNLRGAGGHIGDVDPLDNGHHQKASGLLEVDWRIVYHGVGIGRVPTFDLGEVDTSFVTSYKSKEKVINKRRRGEKWKKKIRK